MAALPSLNMAWDDHHYRLSKASEATKHLDPLAIAQRRRRNSMVRLQAENYGAAEAYDEEMMKELEREFAQTWSVPEMQTATARRSSISAEDGTPVTTASLLAKRPVTTIDDDAIGPRSLAEQLFHLHAKGAGAAPVSPSHGVPSFKGTGITIITGNGSNDTSPVNSGSLFDRVDVPEPSTYSTAFMTLKNQKEAAAEQGKGDSGRDDKKYKHYHIGHGSSESEGGLKLMTPMSDDVRLAAAQPSSSKVRRRSLVMEAANGVDPKALLLSAQLGGPSQKLNALRPTSPAQYGIASPLASSSQHSPTSPMSPMATYRSSGGGDAGSSCEVMLPSHHSYSPSSGTGGGGAGGALHPPNIPANRSVPNLMAMRNRRASCGPPPGPAPDDLRDLVEAGQSLDGPSGSLTPNRGGPSAYVGAAMAGRARRGSYMAPSTPPPSGALSSSGGIITADDRRISSSGAAAAAAVVGALAPTPPPLPSSATYNFVPSRAQRARRGSHCMAETTSYQTGDGTDAHHQVMPSAASASAATAPSAPMAGGGGASASYAGGAIQMRKGPDVPDSGGISNWLSTLKGKLGTKAGAKGVQAPPPVKLQVLPPPPSRDDPSARHGRAA